MRTHDLRWPQQTAGAVQRLAGAGGLVADVGFCLWWCRLPAAAAPLRLSPPAGTREQVVYVTSGRGWLRHDQGSAGLSPQRAWRVPDGVLPTLASDRQEALEALYFASPRPAPDAPGQTADLTAMEGTRFPANRWGRAIANGASPLKAAGFTAGLSVLGPGGGQVPWHNHPDGQREVYLLLGGTGQVCIADQVRQLHAPALAAVDGSQWHQLTNLHPQRELAMVYCYEGCTAAPHWWQERDGVLPPAGSRGNPPLPDGAFPQCTETDPARWQAAAAAHLAQRQPGS